MNGAEEGKDRGSTESLSQPSALEKLTSGIEEGKQYTGAETLKLVKDALSADGREQKDRAEKAETEVTRLTLDHSNLTTQFNTVSSQVAGLVKAQDDAELEAYKEDKPAQDSVRVKQANRAEALRLQGVEADVRARETNATQKDAEADKKLTSINIKVAAMAAGVDEKALADIIPGGDPERLTKAANILKLSGNTEIDPLTGKPKPVALTQKPASALSAGSGGESGVRQIVEKAKKRAGVQ